ncbi:helix-turn-helix protein [Rhodovulum imhoffii]|uniref:Helix-turn-helix protein n=1 Tax=Rhodovulum imhoffii TaxID=365340 RepID=A0A2T5BL06_9RHOB|nr:response regulator [Rhodovulum imhoffii]PTM99680.1 helix-turn-helix protein [Rhodovulum imhoffii]
MSILVVEDQNDFARLIQLALSQVCPVSVANSVAIAKERLLTQYFDFVLIDIGLGDGSGFEIAEFIRKHDELARVRIIFVSAEGGAAARDRALELGADDFIEKPIRLNELVLKVRNKLHHDRIARLGARSSGDAGAESAEQERFNATTEPFSSLFHNARSECEDIRMVMLLNRGNPNFRLEDAASALATSKRSLHRRLKHCFGQSFSKVMSSCRLEHGYRLLEAGHSVGFSAKSSGFRSSTHFSTAFHRQFGYPPSSLQKRGEHFTQVKGKDAGSGRSDDGSAS